MATKKRKKTVKPTVKSTVRSTANAAAKTATGAFGKLKSNLAGAVHHLRSVEASVEKRVRNLVRKNAVSPKDARKALASLSQGAAKERRAALKRIDAGLKGLQNRARKEGKAAARVAEDTVRRTLAALNIPSRREIVELTRKVDDLSRRIASTKTRR